MGWERAEKERERREKILQINTFPKGKGLEKL